MKYYFYTITFGNKSISHYHICIHYFVIKIINLHDKLRVMNPPKKVIFGGEGRKNKIFLKKII